MNQKENKIIEIGDNLWYAIVLSICTVCAAYILTSIPRYYANKNSIIQELVKGGSDPLEVKCTLSDENGKLPVCILLAARGNKEIKELELK